jgi:hypothetical protein
MPFEKPRLSGSSDDARYGSDNLKENYYEYERAS